MKPWKVIKLYSKSEQIISAQPTPEFDAIEFWFTEIDDSHHSGILYIDKEELQELMKSLQEMMDYVTS